MVKYNEAALDATFGALADRTRRSILARLATGEHRVTELAAPFRMSLPAVSKHLRVLERARLVRRTRDGRVHRMNLSPLPLAGVAEWVAHYSRFWEEQFDALEEFIEAMKKEDPSWKPQPLPEKPSESNARSPRRGRKSSRRGRSRR